MVRITLNKPMPEIPDPVVITAVKYGLLYNHPAITDTRKITSSDDWFVVTNAVRDLLRDLAGGYSLAGKELKETGNVYWFSQGSTTNSLKFNARGGGQRLFDGTFSYLRINGYYHTQDLNPTYPLPGYDTQCSYRFAYNTTVMTYYSSTPIKYGLSIRLCRLNNGMAHLSEGYYTGNNGLSYRTIAIEVLPGTVYEFLADNLCETKYRNGDTIPEVTNNAAWAALSTGALCAYNNDWSNVLI